MPRIDCAVSDELLEIVKAYREEHNLKSNAAALVELANIGALQVYGTKLAPAKWGGDRKSREYLEQTLDDLEHEEVKRRGFPPLADDG